VTLVVTGVLLGIPLSCSGLQKDSPVPGWSHGQ